MEYFKKKKSTDLIDEVPQVGLLGGDCRRSGLGRACWFFR